PFSLNTVVTTSLSAATSAVAGLIPGAGGDLPESQVAALDYAVSGIAITWPALNGCAAGSLAAVTDTPTAFGALKFRKGALPMVMEISDAEFHNGVHTVATEPADSGPGWCIADSDPTTGATLTTCTGPALYP